MSYLSQHSMTASSRTEPPGCAMYFTPLLVCSFDVIGKWEERIGAKCYIFACWSNHALLFFSCKYRQVLPVKYVCHTPICQHIHRIHHRCKHQWHCLCSARSNAVLQTAGQAPGETVAASQLSAFCPASLVQWIRDCCPAPIPIACPPFT